MGSNTKLVEYVRHRIIDHKESPDVVVHRMSKDSIDGPFCTNTLYSYIAQGLSIEQRPKEVKTRKEEWINCYLRKLLNYVSPNDLFATELKTIS